MSFFIGNAELKFIYLDLSFVMKISKFLFQIFECSQTKFVAFLLVLLVRTRFFFWFDYLFSGLTIWLLSWKRDKQVKPGGYQVLFQPNGSLVSKYPIQPKFLSDVNLLFEGQFPRTKPPTTTSLHPNYP